MNKINDKIRPEHKKKTNTDNNEFEYSVDMKLLPLEPIRENLVEYKTEPKSKVGDHGGRENSKQHEGKDKAKDRNQDAWQWPTALKSDKAITHVTPSTSDLLQPKAKPVTKSSHLLYPTVQPLRSQQKIIPNLCENKQPSSMGMYKAEETKQNIRLDIQENQLPPLFPHILHWANLPLANRNNATPGATKPTSGAWVSEQAVDYVPDTSVAQEYSGQPSNEYQNNLKRSQSHETHQRYTSLNTAGAELGAQQQAPESRRFSQAALFLGSPEKSRSRLRSWPKSSLLARHPHAAMLSRGVLAVQSESARHAAVLTPERLKKRNRLRGRRARTDQLTLRRGIDEEEEPDWSLKLRLRRGTDVSRPKRSKDNQREREKKLPRHRHIEHLLPNYRPKSLRERQALL